MKQSPAKERGATTRSTEMDLLYVAMHPSRLEIMRELGKKKSYALKLEQLLKINRKVVLFHLSTLLRYGLIKGEFGLKNEPETRPIAVKYFELTDKGKEVLDKLNALN